MECLPCGCHFTQLHFWKRATLVLVMFLFTPCLGVCLGHNRLSCHHNEASIHIRAVVSVPGALLQIQQPAHVPGQAAVDGSSDWILAFHCGDPGYWPQCYSHLGNGRANGRPLSPLYRHSHFAYRIAESPFKSFR